MNIINSKVPLLHYCYNDGAVFFSTKQFIKHKRQTTEAETLPIACWEHSKHIASLHKHLHDFQLLWIYVWLEVGLA